MNPELSMTLDEAVAELNGTLMGSDLQLRPELDRYQSLTRFLNRSMRSLAIEHEWSYYSDVATVGTTVEGVREIQLRNAIRPRVTGEDSVRLCDRDSGRPLVWAYYYPRDAIHKVPLQVGLWCTYVRQSLLFSRPFTVGEANLDIQVPVMREPRMIRIPGQDEDLGEGVVTVPEDIRMQEIDFPYPDLVIRHAAYSYAQVNELLQPRVPFLQAEYKDLMYSLVERDKSITDAPLQNEWTLGIAGTIQGNNEYRPRPQADPGVWNTFG